MRNNPIKTFQIRVASSLRDLLGGVEAKTEWSTMAGQVGLYSPRIDIAVGPFATGNLVYSDDYDGLLRKFHGFVYHLYEQSNDNIREYGNTTNEFAFDAVVHRNSNSRCFLAIEIENRVSRKHLMGGAINAAALGRLGIAVGWTEDKVRAFVKLREYLLYLSSVGKNTFDPTNLLVLSKEQITEALGW